MKTARRRALGSLLIAALAALALLPAAAAQAATYVPISGAGSSWSSNAIQQWQVNVQQYGMRVNYASTGSSDGRNQFKAGTVDFAVSEIPYGIKDGGVTDAPPTVGYAYMPIVAGGTSFMYNLTSGGRQVTNLRLSGPVITGIFTGKITTWNDPRIAKDNPGLDLPKRQIVPVVRSDGSGSTAQFTTWMSQQYPSDWNSYCAAAGRSTPCGVTSNYPTIPGKGFIAQPNSQGVSGYVAQKANVGTITYVEYSYALKTGYPVAKVLNRAGYYVEPTASNVAVGLLGATINENKSSPQYLTQILTGVYNNADPRAYPLSSYSYMIVPTSTATNFTEAKGKTLGAFANYFLCEGQQQAEVLGYSPLPINLVKAGLAQVTKIPGVAATSVNIQKCNNPTFSTNGTNTLAVNAPQPAACDRIGASQCTVGTGGAKAVSTPTTAKSGSSSTSGSTKTGTTGTSSGSSGSTSSGSSSSSGASGSSGSGTSSGAGSAGSSSGPTSGGVSSSASGTLVSCDSDSGVCTNVAAIPVSVNGTGGFGPRQALMIGAVAALLAIVFVPAAIALLVGRRRLRK